MFLLLIAFPPDAFAQSKERLAAREGLVAYNRGDYATARKKFAEALVGERSEQPGQRVLLHKYAAFCAIAFNQPAEAKAHFMRALDVDPKIALDPKTVSPKILEAFNAAKAEWVVAHTVAPIPTPVPPKTVDQIGQGLPILPSEPPRGFSLEASAVSYSAFVTRRYGPISPGIQLSVWRALGNGWLDLGAGAGLRHLLDDHPTASNGALVGAPFSITTDMIPLELLGRVRRPLGNDMEMFLRAGLGADIGRSTYATVQQSTSQMDTTLAASAGAGVSRNVGKGRLVVSAGARASRHTFFAHDGNVLHGFEFLAGYEVSF